MMSNFPRYKVLSRKHRNGLFILVGILILGTSVYQHSSRLSLSKNSAPPDRGQDEWRYHQKVFEVVKVIDGDTVDINLPDGKYKTTRIRLRGIDTPETKQSKRGQMYFGSEASNFTRDMVLNKRVTVVLDTTQESRDRYGRLLAYLFLPNGTMVNQQIIEKGYGYAYEGFDHIYLKRFLNLQKQAKKHQKGLWKEVTPDQWPAWYHRRHNSDD